jgi:hypothetical protein
MTDNYPKTAFHVDDGHSTAIFKVSGSVGVSPNRPVCATGALKVQQIVCVAAKYIGVVGHSGSEGEPISVWQGGTVKAYITGTVEAGDPLEATGTSVAAAFKVPTAVATVSGSTYGSAYQSTTRIAAYAQHAGTDGDLILIKLV